MQRKHIANNKRINTKTFQTFINKCLRNILGILWPEKIRNEDHWDRPEQEKTRILGHSRKAKLDWPCTKKVIAKCHQRVAPLRPSRVRTAGEDQEPHGEHIHNRILQLWVGQGGCFTDCQETGSASCRVSTFSTF